MSEILKVPEWPSNPPADWLTFHLAHPGPGNAWPGDPNCGFHYKGRYHLFYIYNIEGEGYVFAHVSSPDMVHWKWHPTVLRPSFTGHGMFSGTGFYTKDGIPAMIYCGQGSGKDWLTFAQDDNLDSWSKPEPVVALDDAGNEVKLNYCDPDLWLVGDTYYAMTGSVNSHLLRSADLKTWKDLGLFLHDDHPSDLGVPRDEDISCANLFRIGNKWMLLCISHPLGCRYYLGDLRDGKFLPESHHYMNWKQNGGFGYFFAPESLLTDDGRRVMWAWLMGAGAPSGIQSLPRELELPADGVLRIRPLRELETLRHDGTTHTAFTVKSYAEHKLEDLTGDALELQITVERPLPAEFRICMLGDEEGKDALELSFGAQRPTFRLGTIEPPFALPEGEDLSVRIFIDKSLVEVFANDRQAAAFTHTHIRENPNIRLLARGGNVRVRELRTWKMKTTHGA